MDKLTLLAILALLLGIAGPLPIWPGPEFLSHLLPSIVGVIFMILACLGGMKRGSKTIGIITIIYPLLFILIPLIRKFIFRYPKLWFFDMSISFSLTIIIYTISYIYQKRKHFKYLALMIIFQPFAWLFTFLGGPIKGIPWIVDIRNQIINDAELRTTIGSLQGLLQGLCGIYIYFLGDKLNKLFLRGSSREYINRLQYVVSAVPIISIFSVLVSIVALINQTSNSDFIWLLRSTLATSGFLLGIISIASGIVWGCELNILLLLGSLFNFCINFIVGVMIIPLSGIGEYSFPVMMAFALNSSLLTGLICYLGSDRNSFLSLYSRSLIPHVLKVFSRIKAFLGKRRSSNNLQC